MERTLCVQRTKFRKLREQAFGEEYDSQRHLYRLEEVVRRRCRDKDTPVKAG